MIRSLAITARARAYVAMACMAFAGAAHAAPLTDACPAQLDVKQAIVKDVAGWASVNQQESYPFARIALFDGPPSNDARLVPTTESRRAIGLHDTWRLPKPATGVWVQCQYASTTAMLVRKLDDDNVFCKADYDPRFSTLVVKHWACLTAAQMPAVPKQGPGAKPPALRATHAP